MLLGLEPLFPFRLLLLPFIVNLLPNCLVTPRSVGLLLCETFCFILLVLRRYVFPGPVGVSSPVHRQSTRMHPTVDIDKVERLSGEKKRIRPTSGLHQRLHPPSRRVTCLLAQAFWGVSEARTIARPLSDPAS